MERFKSVKVASILGIIGNLFLLIIKAIVGFITNSQAMIADAFNSFSDILSSIMTYIGNRIASIPKDDDHNLGHGKAEYIYSLLISITMFILGSNVLINAIKSLIYNNKYIFSNWTILVCIITIFTKFLLYIYTNKLAKKYKNLLIKANSIDHRNDCLLTSLNLIASIFALFKIYFIDSIVGIFIAIWIIVSGIKIFKESYDVLMDKSMDDATRKKVLKIVEEYKEVKKVNHFNATPVGYKYQISFTIFVDGNLSTFKSHEIANKLEKEIDKKIDEVYLTVIHVNPM